MPWTHLLKQQSRPRQKPPFARLKVEKDCSHSVIVNSILLNKSKLCLLFTLIIVHIIRSSFLQQCLHCGFWSLLPWCNLCPPQCFALKTLISPSILHIFYDCSADFSLSDFLQKFNFECEFIIFSMKLANWMLSLIAHAAKHRKPLRFLVAKVNAIEDNNQVALILISPKFRNVWINYMNV